MNRRAAAPTPRSFGARLLLAILIAVSAAILPSATLSAAGPVGESPEPVDTETVATVSPIATNEFLPEDRDLTDCIGVLERPGCGSEQRGGWRQFAVLGVIVVGLVVIFGNVARGVRRNRS